MTEFVDEGTMKDLRVRIEELFQLEEGLTNWEIDFLDSLNEWDGPITEPQAETLIEIYERLL